MRRTIVICILVILVLLGLGSCDLLGNLTGLFGEDQEDPAGPTAPAPPPTYSVIYNGNGSDGGSTPVDSTAYTAGSNATIMDNTNGLTLAGATFGGWNTEPDGSGTMYAPGSGCTVLSGDVTLYAVWMTGTEVTFTAIGSTTGMAADGQYGSTDLTGINIYFHGLSGVASWFEVYDTGDSPAAGVSVTSTKQNDSFRITTASATTDFILTGFDVYNPNGAAVTLTIGAFADQWPGDGDVGDIESVEINVGPNCWTTVPLTGFSGGMSAVLIDFVDATELYFNSFFVSP